MLQAVTLFADDARKEVGSKKTLVGISGDIVRVEKFPVLLPKLAMFTRVNVPHDWNRESFTILLRSDGDEDEILGSMTLDRVVSARENASAKGFPFVGVVLTSVSVPFPVEREKMFFAILTDGVDEIVCGAIAFLKKIETVDEPSPGRRKRTRKG